MIDSDEEYTSQMMSADLKLLSETEDIDELIYLTMSKNDTVRLKATQQMCPCRVGRDHPDFW
jgi:hypothetical protein